MLIKLYHSNAVSTEGLGRDMILAGQRSLCVYPLKETEIQWRGESSESQWQWCIPGLEHSLAGPDVCFRGIPGIKFKNLKRLFKKQFKLNISGWKKKTNHTNNPYYRPGSPVKILDYSGGLCLVTKPRSSVRDSGREFCRTGLWDRKDTCHPSWDLATVLTYKTSFFAASVRVASEGV